jgi:hypothetical protein
MRCCVKHWAGSTFRFSATCSQAGCAVCPTPYATRPPRLVDALPVSLSAPPHSEHPMFMPNLELLCVLHSLCKYPSAPLDAKPMTSDLRRP